MNFEIDKNNNTKSKILNFLKLNKLKQFNSKQYLIETPIKEKIQQKFHYKTSCVNSEVNYEINSEINSEINFEIDSEIDCYANSEIDCYVNSCVNSDLKVNLKNFCNCCNNKDNGQFIILSCSHTFHIKCLATKMNLNNTFIEEDSFYCEICNNIIDSSEIFYIYNKFYKQNNEYIDNCNNKIKNLESSLNKIKDELKIIFEYKQKLEKSKEYSKIVILTLNNSL